MRIMIVDDSNTSLLILTTLASELEGCEVLPFATPQDALAQMPDMDFDIAITDFQMPVYNGVEFVTEVVRFDKYKDKLIVIVTADTDLATRMSALNAGAIDFLTKPINPVDFHERLKNLIALSDARGKLAERAAWLRSDVDRAVAEIRAREEEIIHRLAVAANFKDPVTASHAMQVGYYAEAIAMAYGLSEEDCSDIRLASSIRDVGGMVMPGAFLFKKGKLTEREFNLMQKHTMGDWHIMGSTSGLLRLAAEIAGSHRERWDGNGYPLRRAGKDIPLSGRIVAVADNFHSLTTSRPYKEAWTFDHAANHIRERSGTQFDPACVTAFLETLRRLYDIKRQAVGNSVTSSTTGRSFSNLEKSSPCLQ